MNGFKAMKAVYCYYFPEVRPIIHEVDAVVQDDMYLVTTPADKVRKDLELLFDPSLDVPANTYGNVDLDEIHVPIIERIVDVYSGLVPALGDFGYSYPTSGSSEGIFHALTKLKVEGVDCINVLKGEYEGYSAQAGNLKMEFNEVDLNETDISEVEPGYWFISNPSARDGNIIPNEFITELCELGNKVFLDLAYAGSTRPCVFDVSHENVVGAFMSFSKPYGVFRKRIGGFAFSRDEMPTLFGNKWFKDTDRLFAALK
ncbi:MAG: aminotransferase class I/II-fold pyridoxal phosphate-dependent enzyme, partial [Candidatus Aenigmarchaeota archaeon]|nr:aminotransferase class I/II-fold pyridoxal phosphate-dependent enzyme [Candidatus Aenigmarchaeota archaeon]